MTDQPISRKYNLIRSKPQPEEKMVIFKLHQTQEVIRHVDMKPKMPPVYDQGQLGSCVENAIAAAYEYDQIIAGYVAFVLSRLFLYWVVRVKEGTVNEDSGSSISDALSCLSALGACPEPVWPYDISKFKQRPSIKAFTTALKYRGSTHQRVVQQKEQIKQSLILGLPILVGIQIYASFESEEVAKTGVVPTPAEGEECLGGHAVSIVGFDEEKQVYYVRNSWGEGWGDKGYFTLPMSYIHDPKLAYDFWNINHIPEEQGKVAKLSEFMNISEVEHDVESFFEKTKNFVSSTLEKFF